jgi:hypothetical protein
MTQSRKKKIIILFRIFNKVLDKLVPSHKSTHSIFSPFKSRECITFIAIQVSRYVTDISFLNEWTSNQWLHFFRTIIDICRKKFIQPSTPSYVFPVLRYTGQFVQDMLDAKKKGHGSQNSRPESAPVAWLTTVADTKRLPLFAKVYVGKNQCFENTQKSLCKTFKCHFVPISGDNRFHLYMRPHNLSLLEHLLINQIFIEEIFVTNSTTFKSLKSVQFLNQLEVSKNKSYIGDSYSEFCETNIFNAYQYSHFPHIPLTRVGIARNSRRAPLAKTNFEAPRINYIRESLAGTYNKVNTLCECLTFGKSLPSGTGCYELNLLEGNKVQWRVE